MKADVCTVCNLAKAGGFGRSLDLDEVVCDRKRMLGGGGPFIDSG